MNERFGLQFRSGVLQPTEPPKFWSAQCKYRLGCRGHHHHGRHQCPAGAVCSASPLVDGGRGRNAHRCSGSSPTIWLPELEEISSGTFLWVGHLLRQIDRVDGGLRVVASLEFFLHAFDEVESQEPPYYDRLCSGRPVPVHFQGNAFVPPLLHRQAEFMAVSGLLPNSCHGRSSARRGVPAS